MEYLTTPTGPMRDHSVVRDSSTVKKLASKADKMQAYRSPEQLYTDNRQATGYQLRGPLPFKTYETGRSSMPGNDRPSAVFLDELERGIVYAYMDGHEQVQT